MRIVVISDTRGLHRQLKMPSGDLLIHAGDFTFYTKPPSIISDFNAWLGKLPHRQQNSYLRQSRLLAGGTPRSQRHHQRHFAGADSDVVVEGLKIWGSPVTPLYGGAFGMSSAADRKRHGRCIPDDTDILITHGPPLGILDAAPGLQRHEGCPELMGSGTSIAFH